MKTRSKALLLSLCAVLLVAVSVFGTMAYLTSTTEVVKNTFTVGNVSITLDEAPVDAKGQATNGDRVVKNDYTLIPGVEYDKDPTVHVTANSEDSWIFVKVVNNIEEIEDTPTIATQITTHGWTKLTNVPDVYYKEYTKSANDTDLVVFEKFTIDGKKVVNVAEGDATPADKINIADYDKTTVEVTAYAIQMAGFEDKPAEAWEALEN